MTTSRTLGRLLAALIIAIAAAAIQLRVSIIMPHFGTDFDPVRFGARLLLRGESPYSIGRHARYFWNFPLLYPLPAVLVAIPFLVVPVVLARVAFVALSSGLLAFACTRAAWWPLLIFASACFLHAVLFAQWAPLLLATWYVPALGFVLMAKPNIGAAVIAATDSRRKATKMIAGCVAIVLVSFIARPGWVVEWLQSTRGQEHIRPLGFSWLGAPLALAATRWRRPEARLILALGFLPQNPAIYEGLLLFAVPTGPREALFLATISWFVEPLHAALHPGGTFASGARAWAGALLLLMYLPALLMVLRRPNTNSDMAIRDCEAATASARTVRH